MRLLAVKCCDGATLAALYYPCGRLFALVGCSSAGPFMRLLTYIRDVPLSLSLTDLEWPSVDGSAGSMTSVTWNLSVEEKEWNVGVTRTRVTSLDISSMFQS